MNKEFINELIEAKKLECEAFSSLLSPFCLEHTKNIEKEIIIILQEIIMNGTIFTPKEKYDHEASKEAAENNGSSKVTKVPVK